MTQIDREPRLLLGGAVTGLMFMASKSIEYFQKFAHGITPGTNPFYMWYFTLTGIHLAHVVAGTSLLTYLWVSARDAAPTTTLHRAVPESVASYWHLVDLLWIVHVSLALSDEGGLMSVLRERVTWVWLAPDGVDVRDNVGVVEGSVQPRRRGGRYSS